MIKTIGSDVRTEWAIVVPHGFVLWLLSETFNEMIYLQNTGPVWETWKSININDMYDVGDVIMPKQFTFGGGGP